MQQQLNLAWIAAMSVLSCCLALALAPRLFHLLIKRVRWLLLSMTVLFSLMTPGVLVFSAWGVGVITIDGLLAGAEQALRLVSMLALLALLLALLGHNSIVVGLYALLRPFSVFGVNQKRIAVRMLLVLDHVALRGHEWRALIGVPVPEMVHSSISLQNFTFGKADVALGLTAAVIVIASLLP